MPSVYVRNIDNVVQPTVLFGSKTFSLLLKETHITIVKLKDTSKLKKKVINKPAHPPISWALPNTPSGN